MQTETPPGEVIPPKKPDGQAPSDQPPKTDPIPPGEGEITDLETAKKVIADLRKENAKTRTTSKDQESKLQTLEERYSKMEKGLKGIFGEADDDLTPEQRLAKVQAAKEESDSIAAEAANRALLLELASEHDISKDKRDYFQFLIAKAVDNLEEDEELSDEAIAEIATKAKASAGASSTTTVPPKKPGDKAPVTLDDPNDVSLDQFVQMSFNEKTELFKKNEDLYRTLFAQAQKENKLV